MLDAYTRWTTASDASRLRLQLGSRFHCRTAHKNLSPRLQCNAQLDSAELSGHVQDTSSYSFVKSKRRSSQICHILSTVVKAHDLTRRPVDGYRNYVGQWDHQPPQNEVHFAMSASIGPYEDIRNGGILSLLTIVSRGHPIRILRHDRALAWRLLGPQEAEGEFQAPIGKLREVLRLWEVSNDDIPYHEFLAVADYLERLGLDVYFKQEINSLLERVYRIWTGNGLKETAALLGDLKCVALAFYLLRSHGYNVQPSIFELYRKDDGTFAKTSVESNAPSADSGDLLNLLRASDLRFPSDAVLQDVYKFASTALSALLEGPEEESSSEKVSAVRKTGSEKTSAEIRYRLKYPWALNLRMLETRQTILNFQLENVTSKSDSSRLSWPVLSLMLVTATRLINKYVSRFQRDIEELERWSKESGLQEENKYRPESILQTYYLALAYEMPQDKYAYTRDVQVKAYYIFTIMDDFYEVAASIEECALFNEAWRTWNHALSDKLPSSLRILYREMYKLTNTWAKQSSIWHGRDLLDTLKNTWAVRMEVFITEKTWVATDYQFTKEDYMNIFAQWSIGVETIIPLTYYALPGGKVSPEFSETRPDMDVIFGIARVARFLNDAVSYEHEKEEECTGKENLNDILMDENPEFTQLDAFQEAKEYARSATEETVESFLCCEWPNNDLKSIMLSHLRVWILMYSFCDGLRSKNWVLGELMDPIPSETCYCGMEGMISIAAYGRFVLFL